MGLIEQITIFLILGFIFSTVSTLRGQIKDPSIITRFPDGNINWAWCIYKNIVTIIVSTLAATLVGAVVVPMIEPGLDILYRCGIVAMCAIVGDDIWDILGDKAKRFMQKWLTEDGESSETKSRRGRRQK
jgi:uncharacterized membrane protein